MGGSSEDEVVEILLIVAPKVVVLLIDFKRVLLLFELSKSTDFFPFFSFIF